METFKIDRRTAFFATAAFFLGGCSKKTTMNERPLGVKRLSEDESDAIANELNAPILDPIRNPPPGFESKHHFSSSDIPARLAKIDWFANCGKTRSFDLTMPIQSVKSWKDATQLCSTNLWDNAQLEAQNQLTIWLHRNDLVNYRKWNDFAKAHKKETISPLVQNTIRPLQKDIGFDDVVVSCVEWDVLGALMENSYLKSNHSVFFFFELLMVYEAGHFPCGWSGKWPTGELYVY